LTVRILIVDGAPSAAQDVLVSHGGARHGETYAAALTSQLPPGTNLDCFVLAAADGADLPQGLGLSDFHGVAWTGSPLNAYEDRPVVTRQIEFARAAFHSGVPGFGSCWGLQVMTVALGGTVRLNPKGPEVGVGRQITLTQDGRVHAMYAGKGGVFDALCVHQDEVCVLPVGARLLAANAFSAVQAAEVEDGERSFWGVQYHPEYDLSQIAALFSRSAERLVAGGFATTVHVAKGIAADFMALHRDSQRKDLAWRYGIGADILDVRRHRREFANWLRAKVLPRAQRDAP
jgi:GMP synthase (glutamine-hydrolysing)